MCQRMRITIPEAPRYRVPRPAYPQARLMLVLPLLGREGELGVGALASTRSESLGTVTQSATSGRLHRRLESAPARRGGRLNHSLRVEWSGPICPIRADQAPGTRKRTPPACGGCGGGSDR